MADTNQYLDVVGNIVKEKNQLDTDNLKFTVNSAIGNNPDKEAEYKRIATQLNIPIESVRQFPDDTKREANFNSLNLDQVAKNDPKTASFLTNPVNAGISHDDVNNLTGFERVAKSLTDPFRNLVAGIGPDFGSATYGFLETKSKLLEQATSGLVNAPEDNPIHSVSNFFEKYRKGAEADSKSIIGDQSNQGFVEQGINSGFRSTGQMIPALMASIWTGNPQIALGMGSFMAGSQSETKALDQGKLPTQAVLYGMQDAVAEYATEMIPMGKLIKDLKAGSGAVKTIFNNMLREVPTEIGATIWQNFNEWANLNPDQSIGDYWDQLKPDMAQTVIATMTMSALTGGAGHSFNKVANKFDQKKQEAERTNKFVEVLNNLNQHAEASKVRERDTGTAQAFFQSVLQDGVDSVYISPKALADSGMADALAQIPSVAEQYQQAGQIQTDIKLPIADLLANFAGEELATTILPHVSETPNGFTQTTAKEFLESDQGQAVNEQIKQALEQQGIQEEHKASIGNIKQIIADHLNTNGRFDQSINDKYSELIAHHYGTMAGKFGITPEELYNKMPLKLNSNLLNGANEYEQSVSTRIPTAKKALENPLADMLVVGLDSSKAEPKTFEKNVNLVTGYSNYRDDPKAKTLDKKAEKFIDHVVDNLLWLYDQVPESTRNRSKLWYDGARNIVDRWSPKFGTTDAQTAGVLAVLSPQKDWFMNVSLGERILEAMKNQQNTPWSEEMTAVSTEIWAKEQYQIQLQTIVGKKLSELSDPYDKAMWIRTYDQAHNSRNYRLVTPEGGFGDHVVNKDGKTRSKAGWGSMGEIAKAVSIIEDGSIENISNQLGGQHKVRNFYNNIFNPNDKHGSVTIDTHAVAGGLLKPLSGSSPEVTHNFGSGGASSSAEFGSQGTYGLFAEAYRRAGEKRGVLPREMQSITWEAVRGLFSPSFKGQAKNVDFINNIWENYRSKKVTLDEARKQIAEYAQGINEPDWIGSDTGLHEKAFDSSYTDELFSPSVSTGRAESDASGTGDGNSSGNSGQYNQSDIFYSALTRAFEGVKQNSMPAQDWANWLKSNAPKLGVKKEEIEAVGINDYLKLNEGQKLTKDQIIQFLQDNGVQVEDVMLDDSRNEDELAHQAIQDYINANETLEFDDRGTDNYSYVILKESGETIVEGYPTDIARNLNLSYGNESNARRTKYDDYQLNGGKNYKELLLTLPTKNEPMQVWKVYKADGSHYANYDNESNAKKSSEKIDGFYKRDEDRQLEVGYKSKHWSQLNVLAHIRFNERTDSEGNKVLFVEEIQSDMHQDGRKNGYKEPLPLNLEASDLLWDYGPRLSTSQKNWLSDFIERWELASNDAEFETLVDEYTGWLKSNKTTGVEDAPFKDTKAWTALAVKRITRYAVENGFQKVAFVNGEQSADRYDLSKQVDSVSVEKNKDGTYFVDAKIKGSTGSISKSASTENDVAEIIGKELAEKAINKLNVEGAYKTTFEGLDLKVGGEGMDGFYDKILPSVTKDVIKKIGGGNLETVTVPVRTTVPANIGFTYAVSSSVENDDAYVVDAKDHDKVVAGPMSYDDAKAWLYANDPALMGEQQGFTITDKMREAVMGGQALFQKNRGSFNPETLVISLTQASDLSTFLHESGHFFLEMQTALVNELIARSNAGEILTESQTGMISDQNALFKWFGIEDMNQWNNMTLDEKRPYHEQFARGFESYLFEGNAPSLELSRVFQHFAKWLKAIYQKLVALDVKLNDEVRSVFDRMLASDQQIANAEQGRSMMPLFASPEQAGLTPEQFADYQLLAKDATDQAVSEMETRTLKDMKWLDNAKSKILKDLQRQAKSARTKMQMQAKAEVMSQPVYRAWQYLTSPMNREEQESARLSRPALTEMYGKDGFQRLIDLRMTSKTGVSPDSIAQLFDFDSGDAMVQAILEAKDPKEVIADLTDKLMVENYSELATPEDIEVAVEGAIFNDARAKFVATELTIMAKAYGERQTFLQATKELAEKMIGGLRIREIKPSLYANASIRAGKESEKAQKEGDTARALAEKRNQLINTVATRKASDARAEVDRILTYLKKVQKKGVLPWEYYNQIMNLLEKFDLAKSSDVSRDRNVSYMTWVKTQLANGKLPPNFEGLLSKKQLQTYMTDMAQLDEYGDQVYNTEEKQIELVALLLEQDQPRNFRDVTFDELTALRDTVKQIEKMGRLKDEMLTNAEGRSFKEVSESIKNQIIKVALERGRMPQEHRSENTIVGKLRSRIKGFGVEHIKVMNWMNIMGGGANNRLWQFMGKTANDASNAEVVDNAQAYNRLNEILKPVKDIGAITGKKRYYKSIDRSLNRQSVLVMALNMGNASNIQRLLDGEGWTMDQVKEVVESTLTAEDLTFVQNMWDLFESYRPRVAEVMRNTLGYEADWITPQPISFKTPDGQQVVLRGGYAPVIFDRIASSKASRNADTTDAKKLLDIARVASSVQKSFTKERVAVVKGMPLLLDLNAMIGGLQSTIHYIHWQPWAIDANKLMNSLSETMLEYYGPEVVSEFKSWIADTSAGVAQPKRWTEKVVVMASRNVSFASLAFNLFSMVQQVTGYTQSVVTLGPKYMISGLMDTLVNPRQAYKIASEKSSFMRNRATTQMRDIAEISNVVHDVSKFRRVLDDTGYKGILMMQTIVDVPTWHGGYAKAIAEGHNEEMAIAHADQAVIDSQGGGLTKDLSAYERTSGILRIFSGFMSYLNTTLNLNYRILKSDEGAMVKATELMAINAVPTIISMLLAQLLVPSDDEDEKWTVETLAKKYTQGQVSFLMGQFVGIRELSAISNSIAGEKYYGYTGPSGLSAFANIGNFANESIESARQGELTEKFAKTFISALGTTLRLPSVQANKTYKGIKAIEEGETSNPLAIGFGFKQTN